MTKSFQVHARVQTSFGDVRAVEHQTVFLHLTLMTSWANVRFQPPFVTFPGPDNLAILGQAPLREVFGVDVMQALKLSAL